MKPKHKAKPRPPKPPPPNPARARGPITNRRKANKVITPAKDRLFVERKGPLQRTDDDAQAPAPEEFDP